MNKKIMLLGSLFLVLVIGGYFVYRAISENVSREPASNVLEITKKELNDFCPEMMMKNSVIVKESPRTYEISRKELKKRERGSCGMLFISKCLDNVRMCPEVVVKSEESWEWTVHTMSIPAKRPKVTRYKRIKFITEENKETINVDYTLKCEVSPKDIPAERVLVRIKCANVVEEIK